MSGEHKSIEIPVTKFYGKKLQARSPERDETHLQKSIEFPQKWPRLLDPSAVWKIFKRQQDAIQFIRSKKSGLMAFAFQDKFGHRMFLAAHPRVFWFYDTKRLPQDRCSYEIILEHSVCKLYFDLEYCRKNNSLHNGDRMVETFIDIISYYVKEEWDLIVSRQQVLDLDSSTEEKFSRHLVFVIPNVAFQDNYSVGNFVRYVCKNVRDYINDPNADELLCNVDKMLVKELLIVDSKGISKLFCDEAVYTKNRHFRLYRSTKRGKNAPLLQSKCNLFRLQIINKHPDIEEQLFFHSLVTFIGQNIDDLKVLKFEQRGFKETYTKTPVSKPEILEVTSCRTGSSPYPDVDKFVSHLISPGKIWRWLYFSSGSHLVYDTVGYRFCHNIGRQHRSNNIKYIVNMESYTYYQKCYDPDCANFRSPEWKLPPELVFRLEDDSFLTIDEETEFTSIQGHFGMLEEDFVQVMDVVESIVDDIPNFGISDCDMLSLADNRQS